MWIQGYNYRLSLTRVMFGAQNLSKAATEKNSINTGGSDTVMLTGFPGFPQSLQVYAEIVL
jgi:hypothetical protein